MDKGYHRRKEKTRLPKRKILIICEGEKTEIDYFNGFKTRQSGLEILALHGKCTDPINLVKFAKKKMEELSINYKEGDSVWCVFDVDDRQNHEINNSLAMAKAKEIEIILSNPCIELWFLIHYTSIFAQKTREEVTDSLKTHIQDYHKWKNVFPLLIDKLDTAVTHAEELNSKHLREGTSLISRESNPSSQVHKLIKIIKK